MIYLSFIIEMKSQSKLSALNNFECRWNEYQFQMDLINNSEIQIVIISLENLNYFEKKITDEDIQKDPAYKGYIYTVSEIFEYISQSPDRLQIDENGALTLLDKTDSLEKPLTINAALKKKFKFEVLWQTFSQNKKELVRQLNKNFEKDEKRDKQFNEDIQGLKKMDNQINGKIDALDKKLTPLCTKAEEGSSATKIKVKALQQKQNMMQTCMRNLEQTIKSIANETDNKLNDIRPQIQSIKSQLRERMRKIQIKNVDLQSKIDKVEQTAITQYKRLEDINSKISKELQNLTQDTKDDIARLQKKIRELSQCHEKQQQGKTINITTITNNYDSLRSGLEKLQKQGKETRDIVKSTNKFLNDHINDEEKKLQVFNTQIKTNKEQIRFLLETDLDFKKQSEAIQVNIDKLKQNLRQACQEWKNRNSGVKEQQQIEKHSQSNKKPSQNNGGSIQWILRSLMEMKSELLPEQLDEFALKYGHHPRNPHKEHFSVIKQGNVSLSINHVSENSYYNFINRFEICQGKQTSYHLKINKLTLNNLYIGFGTIGVLGSDLGSPQDGIYYYCGNGCIYSGKSVVKSGVVSDTDDELTVEADLSKGRVVWAKNGVEFQQCPIPEKMTGQSLYLVVRSYYQHDEIAIIFQKNT